MALIFCKECKAQISDAASICPQCGVAHPALTKTGQMTILRQARTTGSFHPVQVIVDGAQAGELRDGGRLTLDLAQGSHVVEAAGGGLSRRLEVSVVEGDVLRYTTYFSPWGALGGGLQLVPESEAPQPLSSQSIRKIVGISVIGVLVAAAVIVLIVMTRSRPGSEFVGRWINTKDPTQTVTISRGPHDTSGMGFTYFQMTFGNGSISQAALDGGCNYCPSCQCIGEFTSFGLQQEWDYHQHSDTLSLPGPGLEVFRRSN